MSLEQIGKVTSDQYKPLAEEIGRFVFGRMKENPSPEDFALVYAALTAVMTAIEHTMRDRGVFFTSKIVKEGEE